MKTLCVVTSLAMLFQTTLYEGINAVTTLVVAKCKCKASTEDSIFTLLVNRIDKNRSANQDVQYKLRESRIQLTNSSLAQYAGPVWVNTRTRTGLFRFWRDIIVELVHIEFQPDIIEADFLSSPMEYS